MKKWIGIALIISGGFLLLGSFAKWIVPDKQREAFSSLEGVETIAVIAPNADLLITPENRRDVKAVLRGYKTDQLDFHVRREGNKVELAVEENWFEWFSFHRDVELEVFIPATYTQNVVVEVGAGNVEVTGASQADPMTLRELSLEVSSGNVSLENLQVGRLRSNGSSGNIEGERVRADDGNFLVTSGEISLSHYSGSLKAELTSGNLEVEMEELTGPVNIEATSGDVSLDLPEHADFTLNARVSSGHIRTDLPLQQTRINEDEAVYGVHGSGTHPVNLEVTSGTIRLR